MPTKDPSSEPDVTAIGEWLRTGDPVRDEPPLADLDAQMMRRVVVAEARQPAEVVEWRRPAWAIAAVAVAIALGISVGRTRLRERAPAGPDAGPAEAGPPDQAVPQAADDVRQQLQFATPGGTRVIWVFDSRFKP